MDLAQLVRTVQKHKCTVRYCERVDKKTKKKGCRFRFPKKIEHSARTDVNDESRELECFPERNDTRLNKFNPFIIETWRANLDTAPVLSKKAIIDYLSKYVSKSEVGSKTLKEICSSVCDSVSGSDRAKRAIHKILMKNCVERDISAQEVCHIMMGLKLFNAGGRNFVVVYANSSQWVPLSVNNNNDDNDTDSGGCSQQGITFMQKYAERPEYLHTLCMWDVAKFYNVRNWKLAKKQNVVRVFPRLKLLCDDEKDEEFYRQNVIYWGHGKKKVKIN
jgi:hypothetical protein